MANWQLYNLSELFPGFIEDAQETVDSVSGQVATAAETAASAIDALADLIIDKADPLQAVVDEIIAVLEDTILDTLNTGVYFYYDVEGWPLGNPQGLIGWQGRFKRSFDDPADAARPVFSGTAEIGAILIIGGANALPDLMQLLKALGELFGIKAFLDAWKRFMDGLDGDPMDDIALGIPGSPDWSSAKAGDYIPPLRELADYVEEVIALLRIASGFLAMLQEMAEALQEKADKLREIAVHIEAILNQLIAVLAYSGLYILPLESTTGVEGLKEALNSAGNQPPLQADSYVAGVCLLAGWSDYQQLKELFGRMNSQSTVNQANLGTDLLLVDGDLAVSNTGDLALTPNGRVCLLQDISHLLQTIPGELYAHPDYGAGVGRLFGEEGRDLESRIARLIEDALTFSVAVAGRLAKGSVEVESVTVIERELEVKVACSAIEDGFSSPLNFVWRYGLDDISNLIEQ